jgi:hypothetical protein
MKHTQTLYTSEESYNFKKESVIKQLKQQTHTNCYRPYVTSIDDDSHTLSQL